MLKRKQQETKPVKSQTQPVENDHDRSSEEEPEDDIEEEILFDSDEDEEAADEEIPDSDSDDDLLNDDDSSVKKDAKKFDQRLLNELAGVKEGKATTYYEDSSEEEWDDVTKNRVGNIPMHFYDDYDHIGYNLAGEKVAKPTQKDELQRFMDQQEDPNYWRTVRDVVNQRDVVLSKEEYSLVKGIMSGQFPQGYDPYEPFHEFEYKDGIHPLTPGSTKKSLWQPSRGETMKIRKLAFAIKKGWIKLKQPKAKPESKLHLIWDEQVNEDQKKNKFRSVMPAPKAKLPQHGESYNPPAEYLLDDAERKKIEDLDEIDRPSDFIPQKYSSMKSIPLYANYLKERFHRCLDLFLAPRMLRKPSKNKEIVLPTLPPKQSLKPFPTTETLQYLGHTDKVRSFSVDPTGQWLVSGSYDMTARIWEVDTGRCVELFNFSEVVYSVSWNPDPTKNIIAVATGDNNVFFVCPRLGSEDQRRNSEEFVNRAFNAITTEKSEEASSHKWLRTSEAMQKKGALIQVGHEAPAKVLNWHAKGDYLVAVCPDANSIKGSLVIHQVSTHRSQNPFKKQKGKIQYAKFHPTKPLLFIATELVIKKYNLAEMKLEQKLLPYARFISCFDIHPKGDNLIMGSYDKKVSWFDMDLSTRPYKSFNYHKYAVRKVAYHSRYPMFASCSDDLTLQVFHGTVYEDLLQNPLLVPLKVLTGHKENENLGILDCIFHPVQPWLFSCGADSTIRLFT